MKRILLTGSSGYIATNFINLYENKYDILKFDKADGNDVLNINPIIFKIVDHIVHLAAISGIQQCEENINNTIDDNIFTTMYLVNNAKHTPITFASSQAAKEPNNKYAISKRISENYIKKYSLKYTILRFANVYGGVDYLKKKTSVVSKFVNAHIKGIPLQINGDGSQIRDFIHVYDICRAIDLSIENPINDTVDIGTGIGTSIKELANYISSNIQYKQLTINTGIESNIADITKAKKLLEFESGILIKNYTNNINGK